MHRLQGCAMINFVTLPNCLSNFKGLQPMRKIGLFFAFALIFFLGLPLFTAWQPPVAAQNAATITPTAEPSFQTGTFVRDMVYDGELVWVANWNENTLIRLDAETGTQVGDSIPEPSLLGQNINQPGRGTVALAFDGINIWAASDTNRTVTVLTRTGAIDTSFSSSSTGQIIEPVDLLFDGANMWVLNQAGTGRGRLVKIIVASRTVAPNIPVGTFPTSMTWDGQRIWVTNGLDNSIMAIDTESGQPVPLMQGEDGDTNTSLNVGIFPLSIVFDGRHIWVAHYDGTIRVYGVRERVNEEEETLILVQADEFVIEDLAGLPPRPIQLLYAFEQVWVTNVHDGRGSVTAYRAINGEFNRTLQTDNFGVFPGTMIYTDDEIWVADWVSQKITPLNVTELSIWQGTVNGDDVVTVTPGIWLPTASPTPTIPPTATPESCSPELPPRLVVGGRGRIRSIITQPFRLRPEPDSFTDPIERYPGGTTFDVIGGYVCQDAGTSQAFTFFQVVMPDGKEGWMSEIFYDSDRGGQADYALEPIE